MSAVAEEKKIIVGGSFLIEERTPEEVFTPEDFTEELLRISRLTKNLPPDLAENHDHYLHGLPKK